MWCSDPLLNALKASGYSVVRLPKADIRPLQVLQKRGKDLDRLGELTTLLVPSVGATLPGVSANQQAASISGQRSGTVSLGVGLSFLGNVIGAMGGSKMGLDVQYKNAKTVTFEFNDVFEDRIEVLKLDQFLATADVNSLSRYAAELMEADELYVTTATLKTRKISVEAKQSNQVPVQVDVPVVQQVVGANVKVSVEADASAKVTYEGNVPLVFGFQAVQLFYEQGKYTAFRPLESGQGAMRGLEPPKDDGATRYTGVSPFVRLGGE